MVFSKLQLKNIPVKVQLVDTYCSESLNFTRYLVKDGKIPVGKINLIDKDNGVYVSMVENMNPKLYSHFMETAYQVQVEHCLNRGLKDFEITSDAGFNSHVQHFLSGKRFVDDNINQYIKNLIEKNPKGTLFDTKSLGRVKMFMPKELIQKYIEKIKKNRLLKTD